MITKDGEYRKRIVELIEYKFPLAGLPAELVDAVVTEAIIAAALSHPVEPGKWPTVSSVTREAVRALRLTERITEQ